nr:IS630 family transposase [Salicibibacter cibarius]
MNVKILKEDRDPAIQEVKGAMHKLKKQKPRDLQMFRRYQAIVMYLKGRTYKEIGEVIHCTEQTVCSYVRAYRKDGLEGLIPGQSPGRPRLLTDEQEQEVYQLIVESKPVDVGFPAEMNWTSFMLQDWIKHTFDVTYSDRGVRQLLYRLGFSYTKPTYTLKKADPAKQEVFKQDFETAKKNEGGRN